MKEKGLSLQYITIHTVSSRAYVMYMKDTYRELKGLNERLLLNTKC